MKYYDIKPITDWLQKQIDNAVYADLAINIKVHDGKVTLLEKTVTEKTKLFTGLTGGQNGNNK